MFGRVLDLAQGNVFKTTHVLLKVKRGNKSVAKRKKMFWWGVTWPSREYGPTHMQKRKQMMRLVTVPYHIEAVMASHKHPKSQRPHILSTSKVTVSWCSCTWQHNKDIAWLDKLTILNRSVIMRRQKIEEIQCQTFQLSFLLYRQALLNYWAWSKME